KDGLGPRVVASRNMPEFVRSYFHAYDAPPLRVPLDLAQHIVFGAIEYARGLGFNPAPDFHTVADHLGAWTGPSPIGCGWKGKPLYIQGPYDDPTAIIKRLQRTNHSVVTAD